MVLSCRYLVLKLLRGCAKITCEQKCERISSKLCSFLSVSKCGVRLVSSDIPIWWRPSWIKFDSKANCVVRWGWRVECVWRLTRAQNLYLCVMISRLLITPLRIISLECERRYCPRLVWNSVVSIKFLSPTSSYQVWVPHSFPFFFYLACSHKFLIICVCSLHYKNFIGSLFSFFYIIVVGWE